jgi:hypothetical protein
LKYKRDGIKQFICKRFNEKKNNEELPGLAG